MKVFHCRDCNFRFVRPVHFIDDQLFNGVIMRIVKREAIECPLCGQRYYLSGPHEFFMGGSK
jgi:hypothetical protein